MIAAGGADNLVFGGAGADTITATDGRDSLLGDKGNDSIVTGAGDDLAYGGASDDTIYAIAGNDMLSGDEGNDDLYAGEGFTTLRGGNGDDGYYVGFGSGVTTVIDGGSDGAADALILYKFADSPGASARGFLRELRRRLVDPVQQRIRTNLLRSRRDTMDQRLRYPVRCDAGPGLPMERGGLHTRLAGQHAGDLTLHFISISMKASSAVPPLITSCSTPTSR